MKIRIACATLINIGFVFPIAQSRAQGAFVNLNFESANASVLGTNGSGRVVSATQALPGWTVYIGGLQSSQVFYNDPSLGAASVGLVGPNSGPILQGSYTAVLNADEFTFTGANSAAIGQTGQIPQNAQTLIFWSSPANSLQAAFDGQMLPLIQLGSGANYVIEGANISSFAGQTGELRFTVPFALTWTAFSYLDNIQFSTNALPVPEPAASMLFLVGAALFGLKACKCLRRTLKFVLQPLLQNRKKFPVAERGFWVDVGHYGE